jgi:hypothetical protein
MRLFLITFLLLTFSGPLAIILSGKVSFVADYRKANRESAHLAPDPNSTPDAIIQVYSARTFNWRGIFSVHTWIAIKPRNINYYIVYQVIGWRYLWNLPPLVATKDIPDRNWFNQKPNVILDLRGEKADKLIPQIVNSANQYPFAKKYLTWPGPNSNTFTAYVARHVPDLKLALPSNALGKDYLPDFTFFTHAPSGTGYQFSFFGLFGITLARMEGLEINLLGLIYGFSPATMTLKLPGLGDIHKADLML